MKTRPLPSAKGKALRYAVLDAKNGHLLAAFVFEQPAKNWAAGHHGKVVEIE